MPFTSNNTYSQVSLSMQSPTEPDQCKVLSVLWNPNSDSFVVDFSEIAEVAFTLQATKRNAVSLIRRFYDPFGFFALVTIRFKMLFQKLCRNKLEWDYTLPEELLRQ